MDLLDLIHKTAFLGAEFLTWLWWRSETGEGQFSVAAARVAGAEGDAFDFELWFDDKLTVGSAAINAQENHFKGGHPTSSLEARTALRLGKLAHEAKLRIVRGTQEWQFVVKGHDLSVAGVKIPAVLSREDDEKFNERMFLLDQLDQMLKGLYGQFLEERLSPRWAERTLPTVRAWIAGNRGAA